MKKNVLSIGKASKFLGISIQTLRRWDHSGKLRANKSAGGQRRYDPEILLTHMPNRIFHDAQQWVEKQNAQPPEESAYCPTRADFEIRLHELETQLSHMEKLKSISSVISAAAGEIGNNSFDHNLGNWLDVPGIFFGIDLSRHKIILADRGQGILKTLSRVRPDLQTDAEALKIAFTEIVTGRAPEKRGNGLKFVRRVIESGAIDLLFQTGDAQATFDSKTHELLIHTQKKRVHGCLAFITF